MAENWALIKAQYELLNHEVHEIALSNKVSVTAVEYAIEKNKWERRDIHKALADIKNNTEDSEGLIESLALVKEAQLLPQYIAVETALLTKLEEMVDNVPLNLPVGADMLQKIEATFTSLSRTQGLLARSRNEKGEVDTGGLKILIQNKVEAASG